MISGKSDPAKRGAALLALATLVMAVAVGAGLWLTGSPSEQRARRMDERRIQDLQTIASAIELYWERNARLPAALVDLDSLGGVVRKEDPETRGAYAFRPQAGSSFELCATFARTSEDILRDAVWTHQAGEQCFTRNAETEPIGGGS